MAMHQHRQQLARFIYSMPYGELAAVAGELAEACEDKEARPRMESKEDFASLLYDWAEATAGLET